MESPVVKNLFLTQVRLTYLLKTIKLYVTNISNISYIYLLY